MERPSSDHLHRLIRTMTSAEKRYFKLALNQSASTRSTIHAALFDGIAAMEEYDEPQLLDRFKEPRIKKHFTMTKHRLYEAVLRSLSGFHAENSIDARAWKMLHQVEVLHQKALYEDAGRILGSIKRTAIIHGRGLILLHVIRWEQRLMERGNYATADPFDALVSETDEVLAAEQELHELWALKSRVFMELYHVGQARDQASDERIRSLLHHPLLVRPERLRTARATFLYHHMNAAVAFGTGAMETCRSHLTEADRILHTDQRKFEEEPDLAISTLSNLIYVLVRQGRTTEAFERLHEFRTLPARWNMPDTADLELKLFATSTCLELSIHARMGEFDKALELMPLVERGLDKYGGRMGSMRKAAFYYQVAYVHFGAGKPDLALRWTHRLLNDIRMDDSAEIVSFGRILDLMARIDRGKLDLLPYALRNTSRFLNTRDRMHRFEPLILALVRVLMKARNPRSEKEAYRSFLENARPLEKDPFEQVVFDHLDPIAWAESKLSDRSFQEVARERAVRSEKAA